MPVRAEPVRAELSRHADPKIQIFLLLKRIGTDQKPAFHLRLAFHREAPDASATKKFFSAVGFAPHNEIIVLHTKTYRPAYHEGTTAHLLSLFQLGHVT